MPGKVKMRYSGMIGKVIQQPNTKNPDGRYYGKGLC